MMFQNVILPPTQIFGAEAEIQDPVYGRQLLYHWGIAQIILYLL